jgi:hypothetical protein
MGKSRRKFNIVTQTVTPSSRIPRIYSLQIKYTDYNFKGADDTTTKTMEVHLQLQAGRGADDTTTKTMEVHLQLQAGRGANDTTTKTMEVHEHRKSVKVAKAEIYLQQHRRDDLYRPYI